MGLSQGAGLDGRPGGPVPLLPGTGPHPLGIDSLIYVGGHAGVTVGVWGCRKTPPVILGWLCC